MKRVHLTTAVAALCAAFLSPTALAGEAKNEAPFTKVVVATPQLSPAGEPKDMAPFTRVSSRPVSGPDWFERYAAAHPYGRDLVAPADVAIHQLSSGGEPKNVAPFTEAISRPASGPDWFERYAAAHPYGRDTVASAPATTAGGFHWREALLGAFAATAACLMLVGLAVGRTRRRSEPVRRAPVGA